jgi:hypothetical protein
MSKKKQKPDNEPSDKLILGKDALVEMLKQAYVAATECGVSEKATPEIDKKYSEQLSQALTHLPALDEIVLLNDDQVLTENALDHITRAKVMRAAISYPAKPGGWIISEMAKRQFVINETDTKYLRIAVRYSSDWKLKDSILVFNRRK